MIPKQLTLQNFLSYREVTLDFDGLHVACDCGPNGAGKSSLLEAIAWCVWGQSRVSAEDDIIRQGAAEAQVSFCFEHSGQIYRIIRRRRRAQTSGLEFQIKTDSTFKSITQKGVRATQQYILSQIKIDYETFVNSAYLRQGRADEFMLKGASDRKQVLADLLKLNRYDYLAEQAKEQARTYRAQLQPLEALLVRLSAQIASREETMAAHQQLQQQVKQHRVTQQQQQQALGQLKQQQEQRRLQQQQLALIQQQQQHQQQTLSATEITLEQVQQQLRQTEAMLAQADDICHQYQQLISLRDAEAKMVERCQLYQAAQTQRLQLQQQVNEQQQQQQAKIAQITAQLEHLEAQIQAAEQTLENKAEVIHKLEQLKAAKKELHQLNRSEAQSSPLRLRLRQIEAQIEQAHTRLVTRIEELDNRQMQMSSQQTQVPQLVQAAVEVSHRIAYLEQRREYQEALRQKGLERRNFMERLQANQLHHQMAIAQHNQTLTQLEDPDAACCPLCEQPLAGQRWQALRDRTLTERDEVQNQIWAIREQLAVSDSEIQVLRQEYRVLEEELAKYAPILEERGQLKAKLSSVGKLQDQLQAMTAERAQLERCLQANEYAEVLQAERQQVQTEIEGMNYDERNHALLKSQVDRLRWSELRYAEIKQAERRLQTLQTQQPQLEAELQTLRQVGHNAENSQTHQQALAAVEGRLADIDYSVTEHNHLREKLRQAEPWQSRYHALQQAQTQQTNQQEKIAQLSAVRADQTIAQQATASQIADLQQQLLAPADPQTAITALEKAIETHQEQRDHQLSQLGRMQQQLSQLDTVQTQLEQQQKTLDDIRHKYQVYRSLAEAFGRNGIQALMIENLLPQLEAETNQILSRLSDHQLHVQFVTQRAGRRGKKLIDTLDILIADIKGTRPYETYSGGETFRVNFAIRLAIARLLAMRSGTALQMLIVDEGFGTQDQAGCDRLIAAIEAIAPDFACILTITHMPHFRDAFQTRIDVSKNNEGSHITISE
ncbi:MAG: ATP-binding cassette family protein [Phormidesmis priestleyi]|uniref:Nuclease SbcCD subunit C n=1 Tax=Phormidesmis priestleyi TaxID=268141 RepID=A0A2W4Y001_9CYAN|nr:MAG: ATP-binding cassette family protein [Phormidesmis priestleyi]